MKQLLYRIVSELRIPLIILAVMTPIILLALEKIMAGPPPLDCAQACEKSGQRMESTGPNGCKCRD